MRRRAATASLVVRCRACLAIPLLTLCCFTATAGQTQAPVVTLAGNGIAGNVDGIGAAAEFMEPVSVAVDPATNVTYVADFAGGRIRRIGTDGSVTTLAGSGEALESGLSVAGGYRDGPAATALFDGPSGVAVGPEERVYVADARNHCVRQIENGVVSTLAGSPAKVGSQDGNLSDASFTYPRSLAVGHDGTAYVADYTIGVRVVTKDQVTTLPVPVPYGKTVTNLALLEGPRPALFGAVRPGVWRYDLTTHAFAVVTTSRRLPAAFAPFGVVPIDYDSVVASSVFFDALYLATYPGYRRAKDSRTLQIAGAAEKDQNFVGGFRDDLPERALFYNPMGLARNAAGDILVADGGNRRIRIVPSAAVAAAQP